MASDIEVGLQEVPRAPENVQRRLREFDKRLRVNFNTTRRVWEVQEWILSQQCWSHVCFWADGAFPNYTYRPLPFSAEPLLSEILKRDIKRCHGVKSLGELSKKLEREGAAERASRLRLAQRSMAEKIVKWRQWAYERGDTIMRRYKIGGRDRTAAIQERLDVLRDLGLRQD